MSNTVEMPVKMTYHSNIPAVPRAGSPEANFPHASGLFAVDQGSINLKSKTIRGGAITFIAQGIKVALYVGSTALLARLLTPSDFGLISMVTGITGFVEAFKDAGLSLATVQRE